MTKISLGMQADGRSKRAGQFHQFVKKAKLRKERRRANKDPETPPTYGKYRGWET